ncbi:mandelate racemase/muconate lactonizing enzyme family protein [bacterium]|nr:mandelate racemase/muconate lactonizing enzyme family protein [bacterium]
MKIAKLETFTTADVAFVRVTTDGGETGVGQMSTYHADITTMVFHRQVVPWVLGRVIDADNPVADFADLAAYVHEREHKFPGSYVRRALAGLDTALWDLLGKLAGKPVASLIGGSPGRVRAYASSMKRNITPDDEAARLCDLRDRFGFDAFKFRVGAECGRGQDEWPGRTEEIIPTMSRALGDDVVRMVDANSCFGVDRAIEVGRMLIDHGITHYEEPCPYWRPDMTAKVTAALDVDVTGGEQDCDMRIWQHAIDHHVVDVMQPDVMYMGGLTPTLQVAAMADAGGFACTPHAANLSLVTICTMHLLRAIPNAGPYLELAIEGADYYPWTQNLFLGDPFAVTDGQVTISDAPGWGVEVNPDWLAKAAYQASA